MLNNIHDLLLASVKQSEEEPYYEVLQYITLDGTQYFDTGYYGNTTKTYVDFDLSVDDFTNNTGICGSRNDTTATENSMCILFLHAPLGSSARDALRLDWVGGGSSIFSNTLVAGARYHVTCTSNKGTVNDEVYTSTGIRDFDQNNPFCIGTVCSGSGTVFTPALNGKIYVFKIFESGVLVHDYVPVLDSQMRPCLYDKVEKTFLYAKKVSDGTTTYDLGFKRWNKFDVDYIESSGTQYIDTGYAFQDDFAYEIEYEGLNNGECLLGGRTSSVRTAILYRAMATQVDGQTTVPIAGLNATQTPFKLGVLSENKHKVKVAIANNKGNILVDDTQVYTNTSFTGTYISGKTTSIFADHFGDQTGTSEYQEYATSKLYSLKFWQGTNLVRDYKPTVWHNSDTTAVACLYDEVYNKMYTNAGTGSFKAYIIDISRTKTDVFTTTGATSGKAINAEGTIINSSASSYSDLLPIVGGSVIECVSGNTGNNNYLYHCYDSSGNWIEQSLVLYPEGAGTVEPVTGSFTAPIDAKYVRVSYATQASSTIQVKSAIETTYEVGSNCSVQTATSNYFDSGLYGNEKWNVKLLAFTPTNTTGQLFGVVRGADYVENLTINSAASTGGGSLSRFDSKVTTQADVIHMSGNQKSLLQTCRYGLWQDSTQIMAWSNPDTFTTQQTCHICKVNGSTGIRPNGCCYLAIEEDNVLIAEFIPVRNKTVTSEYGLYDRVSGTLNTGIGTITFNALD